MIEFLIFYIVVGREIQLEIIYYYKEKTGDKEIIFSLREEDKNSEKWIYANSDEEEHIFVLNQNLETIRWIFHNKKNNEKNIVERKENTIVVTKKGKTSETKKLIIDSSPWYQFLEKSLSLLVTTDLTQKEFWIIRPTDFKEFKMIACKEKKEKINMIGKEFNSVKISVSLPGVVSLFWRVYYWFDRETGLYLKYEGKRGGLSVPKTFVELYRVEVNK